MSSAWWQMQHEGQPRQALVSLVDQPRAVLLLLHGTGASAAFAADETGLAREAVARRISVLFPEALPIRPEQTPAFLTNPRRWNDGSTTPGMALHSDHPDTAYLDQVLATVRATPGHEVVPIFLAGFSNGAGMAFRYASERGEMLRGVIPVAGHRPTIPESLPKPIATFYIVGAEDPLIPWAGGAVKSPWYRTPLPRPSLEAMLAGWAQDMHCGNPPIRVAESDVSWEVIYPGGTVECRCAVIRNHGHHWPGGKGQLNPRIAGVNASGFSANQRILDWIETQLPPS